MVSGARPSATERARARAVNTAQRVSRETDKVGAPFTTAGGNPGSAPAGPAQLGRGGGDGAGGAGAETVAAADALHTVGALPDRDVQLAGALAAAAAGAAVGVHLQLVEGDGIEQAVNGPQRAQIPAEGRQTRRESRISRTRSRLFQAKRNPRTSRSMGLTAARGQPAAGCRRDSTCRTRGSPAKGVHREKGEQNDKTGQQQVFDPAQPRLTGQAAQLSDKGDLVEQVLHQAEGTQPAAHKAAQGRAGEHQKAQHIQGGLGPAAGQGGLEGTQGQAPPRTQQVQQL